MFSSAGFLLRSAAPICCTVLLSLSAALAQAPEAPPPGQDFQQAAPLLPPEQLDNLVAPVALYPDPLLGQVLAASTYPLEITEAQQWLQQSSTLQGAQLMEAARQQSWDPSVQALVAFPDALRLLSSNIRWTTDLGNAFLAQQADVMAAVQRMRQRASANGKLRSTPQQVVTTDMQGDQSAIDIEPADQQMMYVPNYDPSYVWGPGLYPDLYYSGLFGYGYGFGPGIYVGGLFPGWGGWGSWGWGCGWFGRSLFVNAGFFNRFGYRGRWGGGGFGRGGHERWAHNPGHRGGIPYPNRAVAGQFHSNRYAGGGGRPFGGTNGGGWQQFGGNNRAGGNSFAGSSGRAGSYGRGSTGSYGQAGGFGRAGSYGRSGSYGRAGSSIPSQSFRGGSGNSYRSPSTSQGYRGSPYSGRSFSSGNATPRYSAPRTFSSPSRSFSAPRTYSAPNRSFSAPSRSFSAPSRGFSAPSRSFSAPRSSGGFSGGGRGGFSGGHSGGFSGGGRSGGGGGHSGGGGHGGGGRR